MRPELIKASNWTFASASITAVQELPPLRPHDELRVTVFFVAGPLGGVDLAGESAATFLRRYRGEPEPEPTAIPEPATTGDDAEPDAATSLDVLLAHGLTKTDVTRLGTAGIASVEQLAALDRAALVALPGIGEARADKALAALEGFHRGGQS